MKFKLALGLLYHQRPPFLDYEKNGNNAKRIFTAYFFHHLNLLPMDYTL